MAQIEPDQARRALSVLIRSFAAGGHSQNHLTMRTDLITTSSTGTSLWAPKARVGTSLIFSGPDLRIEHLPVAVRDHAMLPRHSEFHDLKSAEVADE